jgi:hypothetical protein
MATKTKKSPRDQLRELVEVIDEARVEALLTLLKGGNAEESGAVEKGPTSADDPLWKISGMVGDEYVGPTDVSENKYRYIAEHPEIKTE